MTEALAAAHRAKMVQIQRLAAALAARVRYAQTVGRPVPAEQVGALVDAARLLHEAGLPWPPLVDQALRACAEEIAGLGPAADEAAPPRAGQAADDGAGAGLGSGLTRLLGALRGGTGRGRTPEPNETPGTSGPRSEL